MRGRVYLLGAMGDRMIDGNSAFDLCQDFLRRFAIAAESSREVFATATPFPHAVFDNLFDMRLIDCLLEEFPDEDDPIWHRTSDEDIQVKLRSDWKTDAEIKPTTREVVRTLNSGAFLKALSMLTGVSKLISDPYYTGGGLNCTLPGGQLDIHCDGNWHHAMGIHRRLNVLLYLNRDWSPSWGGDLELWDEGLSGCQKEIAPLINRMVVFLTHDKTYHGHPKPLRCPFGNSRKPLIHCYYTAEPRPTEHIIHADPHGALWHKRGQLGTLDQ
jgi:Rps23 Pro-64 3,4-dihydroxylase Tpa1-like proline 4-hydroxylase